MKPHMPGFWDGADLHPQVGLMLHSAASSKKQRRAGRSVANLDRHGTKHDTRMSALSALNCTHMRVLGIDCGGEYTGCEEGERLSWGQLVCLPSATVKRSPLEYLAARLLRYFADPAATISANHAHTVA